MTKKSIVLYREIKADAGRRRFEVFHVRLRFPSFFRRSVVVARIFFWRGCGLGAQLNASTS